MSLGPEIRIERSIRIERPVAQVFAFYDRPAENEGRAAEPHEVALERGPRDLRPGAVFAYRLRRWPVEVYWEALVSEYHPPRAFVSVQSRGYFLRWKHEHHFDAEGERTRLRVVMSYELPKGILARLVHRWYLRSALEEMVSARLDEAREALEKGEHRTA